MMEFAAGWLVLLSMTAEEPQMLVKHAKGSSSRPAAARGLQSLGAVTVCRQDAQGILLECGAAQVRVSISRGGTVRVRVAPDGKFGRDFSWAVTPGEAAAQNFKVSEEAAYIELQTPQLLIRVQRDPCRLSFYTLDGSPIAADDSSRGMCWEGEAVSRWSSVDKEDRFFGLGEKGMPFDKRETTVVNWNLDNSEHEPWSDPLYQTHPFVIVWNPRGSYGLFFDNPWRSWFDFAKTSRERMGFGADGGELNYYFIPGPTPADVIRNYSALVGTTPLPPLWSLGYQQCRWSYATGKRVRDIAAQFRKRKIPCDTIYCDIDYMEGFRCFTWSGQRFPKPDRMLKQLAADGFKIVTILDPGIKVDTGYGVYKSGLAGHHFCTSPDGHVYVGKVWPGDTAFPDFTNPATRKWWGEQYQGLVEDGVRGFWNDMNEPAELDKPTKTLPLDIRFDNEGEPADHRAAHNVYGSEMARSTFEGVRKLRPDRRPFVLTRAGYSGVQRYAAVWTGDNASRWDHLRMSVPMLLNMGLSGITFCGTDIGGFRGVCTPELYVRWLQMGIFSPLCRTHTCQGPEQDPFSYGKEAERINRETIELRYRLMPYLYTEMREASISGLPVMRALLLDFPNEPDVTRRAYEFMFGRQILVAPVLDEGQTCRKLRLPAGEWYDFVTGERYAGGREVELQVKLETIPMFARAGAVIPEQEVEQYVGEKPLTELILNVYPGEGGGSWYQDEGDSYAYQAGDCLTEQYTTAVQKGGTLLHLARRSGAARFVPAHYLVRYVGVNKAPKAVRCGENDVADCKTRARLDKTDRGWFHDAKAGVLYVRVAGWKPDESIRVTAATIRAKR